MIIKSILDQDLYKFSTSFAYMKNFPDAEGTFEFIDRNRTLVSFDIIDKIRTEISNLSAVRLTKDEFEYCCGNIRYIPQCYWEWLKGFQYDPGKVIVSRDESGILQISVTDKLYKVTLWETMILCIVSEIMNLGKVVELNEMTSRLMDKINLSNTTGLLFSEFGTRRRFSYDIQRDVIGVIKSNAKYCTGTSNVHFAMKYDMKPIGTHPHEWFMFHGAMFGYKMANYMALENWVNTYDGDLGIALTDTYTSDVFFKNFSKKHAKLFDGIRQDSGDEFEFIEKAISRYKEHGIDPITKTIIFSNGLDFSKAEKINNYCKGKVKAAFGIGTNLTNDCGHKAPNIVMKLTKCRMNSKQPWYSCIKISDDLGKHMGPNQEVETCIYECNIK